MSQKKFITAEWRKLIMANYEIDPEILKRYLPAKTELDTWNNNHYVSLVGFMFLNTKLKGVSIPFHSNFPEVNLRFYVKHKADNDWKRGVVFINEFVPRPAITFVANRLFKEKYLTYPMKYKWETKDKNFIGYYWKKNGKWNNLEVTASLDSYELKPGSKEEFITEHYWGYSSVDQNRTNEYQVEHPRWNIYPVKNHIIDCNFAELYGNEFESLNKSQPESIFLAEGSPVSIYSKKALE